MIKRFRKGALFSIIYLNLDDEIMSAENIKLLANNKKAYHDYFVDETFEAGIVLVGTEVKSLRLGKCSIKEAFIGIDNG